MRNTMLKRITGASIGSLVTASLLMASESGFAYTWQTCDGGDDWILWEADEGASCDGCVTLGLSTTSFPIGGARDRDLQAAMSSWNDVERSAARFTYTRDTNGSYSIINGRNEVVFDEIDGPGDTLAFARLRYNGVGLACVLFDDANISEADVVFDSEESWRGSTFSYTGSGFHFRLVAVHEFGHVLGLHHEDRRMARMNSFYPMSGPITRDRVTRAIADDRAGIRHVYPQAGTARADLVASNYRRTGAGTSGLVNTAPASARAGDSVSIQYTFMNIGSADSGRFNIGFYLSTDDNIDASDILLGTNFGASASAGGTVTATRTLNIPNTIAPRTYYLGVLLDKDGSVTEWSNTNNGLAQWRTISVRNQ